MKPPMTSAKDRPIRQAFRQEVRETKELARLLKLQLRGGKLAPSETRHVQAQLLDIGKLVPVLTLLLLPGGPILVVLLERLLPFSLLPSSFAALLQKRPPGPTT